MEYDWSMNDRIKEIRLLLKKKQGELAQILGIKQSSLSDIENKHVKVSDRVIKDMIIGVNANEEYIRYGTGEPISKTPSNTMEQLKKEFDLDDFDYNLVYEYLKLDPQQRKAFRNYIYHVIEAESENNPYKIMTEEAATMEPITVEEAEAEYIKSRLEIVQRERSSVSSTTAEKGRNRAVNQ